MTTSFLPFPVRLVLASALGSAAVLAQTTPAPSAPETDAPSDEVVTLSTFIVTGSNLHRVEEEKAQPVTILGEQTFEAIDAEQPVDLLMALPEVVGAPLNETSTLGAGARGDNASISLRGLNTGNTLVLLNGRRLAPHPISQSENGVPALSVNVNQLPSRGLSRIDILRDGASSVYGSDAVAGVVNYITNRTYNGSEVVLRFGETEYSDGREYRATFRHGTPFAEGRGHLTVLVDVYDRGAILARDRDFSADADLTNRVPPPWNDVGYSTTFFGRSATSAYGSFRTGTVAGDGTFNQGRPAGVPSSLTSSAGLFYLVPTASGGVGFKTTTPARTGVERDYYWNNNAYRVIQPETTRLNLYSQFDYKLTDRLSLFADLSVYSARSRTYREPESVTNSTDGDLIVPATNPWNPFGTRFWHPTGAPNPDGTPRLQGTPSAVLLNNKRLVDLPERTAIITNDVYRGLVGLRGPLAGSWTWESALLYSQARVTDDEANAVRKSFFQQALNRTDATAYNPFGYTFAVSGGALVVNAPYANPADVQASFLQTFVRKGTTELASFDFRTSGPLVSLWAGNTVTGTLGGEVRYEAYEDYRPPYAGLNPPDSGLDPTTNDFLSFSPNANTEADRHNLSFYAETVIPLIAERQRVPLVRRLELSASVRHEKYSDFGSTTKPKFGVNWRLTPWLMARASYNEGFRAPNLAQLFTGALVRTVTGSTDTYRSSVTGLPTDGSSNRSSIRSGNELLRPETSTGRTAGVVIDVPKVKGLSFSADYWEIRQRGVISLAGSINDDRDLLIAATQAALAAGVPIDQIDLGSGTANYQGDGSVVRRPVTQADRDAFAAYNAGRPADQQRAVVGQIDYLRETYFNKAEVFVSGVDLDATWRLPETAMGRFTLNTTWTHLDRYYSYDTVGAPKRELRGQNGAAVWRGHASLAWRWRNWRAGVSAHYVGPYLDSGTTTSASTYASVGSPGYIRPVFTNGALTYRYRVADTTTYNAYLSWRLRTANVFDDTTLRLGVVNLLGTEPPLSSDSRGYDASVYNRLARGRSWSVQVTKRF
jgi:iron complex outermembrane receptor protein